ncbi:MAG: biotin transporter BioY, partial [bacterium]
MLIICSVFSFTLSSGITYTLQTVAISFIYFTLKLKKSIFVLLVYILIGLIGIPVFSNGGGIHYVFSPTFGYIIGFIPFVIVLHLLDKFNIIFKMLSLIPLYILGAIYMYIIFNYYLEIDSNILYIIQISILPYIIKDVLSILLSYYMYEKRMKHLLDNKEMTDSNQ